jgi:hypothetical protein
MSDTIDDVYTGSTLSAADLNGQKKVVTITHAETRDFEDKPKIVLSFKETDKDFVVNKTNANLIAEALGTRKYLSWVGKKIRLKPSKVEYAGKLVPCIRVDWEDTPSQESENPGAGVNYKAPLDDEIPF